MSAASGGTSFTERVATHLAPSWYAEAHGEHPAPDAVARWALHVGEVRATLRSAAVVGAGLLHEQTLTAVTGMGEGDMLIGLAVHHERLDVAELLEGWLAQLRAVGPDGRPLLEDPTGAHAVVVDLVQRAAARAADSERRSS